MCIFTNGLGFVLYIAGINIVNIMSLVSIGAIFIDMIKDKRGIRQCFQGKKGLFIVSFMLWVLYALVQTQIVNISWEEYKIVFRQLVTNTVIVFFAGYTIHNRKTFYLIQHAMIGVLVVNVVLGMFEVVTGIHFVESESVWNTDCARAFSANPNEYATTVYCSLMCLAFFAFEKKLGFKWWLFIVFSCICILSSNSRGILYAVIIFALAYGAIQFYYMAKGKAAFAKCLLILALSVLGLLAVQGMLPVLLQWFVEHFSGSGNYTSDLYRLTLIRDGMGYFKGTYGLGVGAGQSIYLVKMNLHNFFVEILVEYGAAVFTGVLLVVWSIWRRAFDVSIPKKIRCIYFALIPSMVMASIVSSSINKFKVFWVMIFLFYLSKEYMVGAKDKEVWGKVAYEAG